MAKAMSPRNNIFRLLRKIIFLLNEVDFGRNVLNREYQKTDSNKMEATCNYNHTICLSIPA